MEGFKYKDGCGMCERGMHIKALKEELAWATDKWLLLIKHLYH